MCISRRSAGLISARSAITSRASAGSSVMTPSTPSDIMRDSDTASFTVHKLLTLVAWLLFATFVGSYGFSTEGV